MQQPEFILTPGTKVRTHEKLGSTHGIAVYQRHLNERRSNTIGKIEGVVAGHGGDVYFVSHEGAPVEAVYCFDEFELEAS